jgi:hypothetical protein
MKTVSFKELSEDARELLTSAEQAGGLVVEDEDSQACYSVVPYRRPTAEESQRAWKELRKLQDKVGKSMLEQGVTEDDVLQEILKDD